MNTKKPVVDESMLIQPGRIVSPPGWTGHIPFASWLIARLRPAVFVELGTHTGNSYLAFCQSVQENNLPTKCYAVDTWQGDEHAGHYDETVFNELSEYHDKNYASFSQLLRMTFDDALACFKDASVDLLHIDGLHTYEAVKHDFESWLSRMSQRGVVLFHDICVYERDFGVAKLWEELTAKYPGIQFEHAHGLGVLFVGQDISEEMQNVFEVYKADSRVVQKLFQHLGERISFQYEISVLKQSLSEREAEVADLRTTAAERDRQIVELHATIQSMRNSSSWRLTRPIRFLKQLTLDPVGTGKRVLYRVGNKTRLSFPQIQQKKSPALAARRIPGMEKLSREEVERVLSAFNREYYLCQYPDIKEGGADPFEHYMIFGWKEGRDPCPEFSTGFYLDNSPDLRESGINPFLHWVLYGIAEKRPAVPRQEDLENLPDSAEVMQMLQSNYQEVLAGRQSGVRSEDAAAAYRKAVETAGFKSIGLALIKNEEDIIESSVRHNLNFLDGMVVINNNSSDSSAEILRGLVREGLPVCLLDDYVRGHFHNEKLDAMMVRICDAFFADVIVPIDADELIQAESKESFLKSVAAIPRPGIGFYPWVTYIPHPAAAAAGLLPHQFQYRRKVENPQYVKCIINTGAVSPCGINIAMGSHDASLKTGKLAKINLEQVQLAHFPLRSKSQTSRKVLLGWLAELVKDRHMAQKSECFQWHDIYKKLMVDADIEDMALTTMALNYAQERKPGDWTEHVVAGTPRVLSAESVSGRRANQNVLASVVREWERSIVGDPEYFGPGDLKSWTAGGAASAGTGNGIFEPDWHLKNLFLDVQPFKYLYDRLTPDSVLDLGCGAGQNLHLLKKFGAKDVLGIDGFVPQASFLEENEYRVQDLTGPLSLDRRFDLVICLEVAEHMPPGTEAHLLQIIENHAGDYVLFSAAEPGQPGAGHVNCRPFSFWAELFDSGGWTPLLFETMSFRAISSFSWLRRNPVLLSKRPVDKERRKQSWSKLISISQVPFRWYDQKPCLVNEPLRYAVPPSYT